MRRLLLAAALALAAGACNRTVTGPTGALGRPVDFSYACEGLGQTVAPQNDESATSFRSTRMCPDLGEGGAQGHLFGLVLNDEPPGLNVLQMNPASAGGRRVLDADPFVPGYTAIPVPASPLRVLRASDWSAFYVLSAGERAVTRVVLRGFQAAGELSYETSTFPLPGVPSTGAIVGDTLLVGAAHAPTLWAFDLAASPSAPPRADVALPAPLASLEPFDDGVLATWVGRPVLSVLDGAWQVVTEVGLRPACSDTLDNDGDGLADHLDPDCRDAEQATEDGPFDAFPDAERPSLGAFAAAVPLCEDGLDNDGDGWTDAEDDACADDPEAEGRPACSDGLDNDGDGRTDADDEACYGPADLAEGQLGPYGPYAVAVVDARAEDAGRWVYALDPQRSRVVVFEVTVDGAGPPALARVDVASLAADVPEVTWRSNGGSGTATLDPIHRAAQPGLAATGDRDLRLSTTAGPTLTASRTRGEVWTRLVSPDALAPGGWEPAGCDADVTDACLPPPDDDATWFVYLPRLDGRIHVLEAVRRGVPLHREAQRADLEDPAERGTNVSRPTLSLRGRSVSVGGALREGYPFLGPRAEELLAAKTETTPERQRRFGVWPPDDPEQAPSETWTVTYEGALPGTDRALARFVAERTVDDGAGGARTELELYDPGARFCTDGVEAGDWLALEAAPETVAPELRLETPVVTADGVACPTEAPTVALVEARVTERALASLWIDPATARLRPVEPVLDEDAIQAQSISLAACRTALDELRLRLTRSGNLPATSALSPDNLPERLLYSVRAAGAWVMVGSRTGYLHRQVWDAEAGACRVDEDLDPRRTGRAAQVPLTTPYATCPPDGEAVAVPALPGLLEPLGFDPDAPCEPGDDGGYVRYCTWSFSLDVFPGCELDAVGEPTLVETQRDTRWTFNLTGPGSARSFAAEASLLGVRVGLLDFRREPLQVDASSRKVHELFLTPRVVQVLATYE